MKKAAFIMLVTFVLANVVRGQYSDLYYHRVGDTIEWRAPNGYYSWWEWEAFYDNNIAMNPSIGRINLTEWSMFSMDSVTVLQRFYTPVPLKIIGIAGSGCRVKNLNGASTIDTNASGEYYMIYDAGANDMTLLKQVPWKTTDPRRTLHVKMHAVQAGWGAATPDSCCWFHPADVYFPIYEYYFDTPVYVTDSFYVGGTLWNLPGLNSAASVKTTYNHGCMHHPLIGLCGGELLTSDMANGPCRPSNVAVKCKGEIYAGINTTFTNAPWMWRYPTAVSLVYPIIEVDTTVPPEGSCVQVGNVQALPSGTSATITWDYFPNYTSVVLSYGLYNLPHDQWSTVDVTDTTLYTVTGLIPSALYGVRLKAVCDKQEMPWSSAVQFYTGSDTSTHGESISQPTVLSAQTFLQPNPASHEVSVSSSFNLSRIEISDLSGVLVYSEPATGHLEKINIEYLRSGTYIVTIHTHLGTTHKKLIVQK